ncbi:MAG: protein kinase, partial [Planctomycetota bacterium]|nr:protein kinase [Planctomycetota bacterium]
MNQALEQIGDYRLQSELGRGGMGVVYKAIHQSSGTQVAIKLLLNPNHELKIKSLIEEAVTGKKVDHPNCLKIYEILSYGGDESPAIVSEYVEGLNARDFLDLPLFVEQDFVFSPLSASLIFEQMLRGLRAAHNAGLIHQDIKPENFLIEQEAIDAIVGGVNDEGQLDHDEMDDVLLGLRETSWIKLSDWGLSIYKEQERSMGKSLSISLSRIPEEKRGGTLVYMPPEQ